MIVFTGSLGRLISSPLIVVLQWDAAVAQPPKAGKQFFCGETSLSQAKQTSCLSYCEASEFVPA